MGTARGYRGFVVRKEASDGRASAHRVGIRHDSRPRTNAVRFNRFSDREAVMRNAKKLQGTK